jgi:hypothetical protein
MSMATTTGVTRSAGGRLPVLVIGGLLVGLLSAACSNHPPGKAAAPTTMAAVSTTIPDTPEPRSVVPTPAAPVSVSVPTYVDENGFDDHTVPRVGSIDELMALSRSGVGGQASMKFTIPQFDRRADAPDLARAHLMDGNFYGLHDEWYYYRLLNGQRVPGADTSPIAGQRFATVEEIYRWAAALTAAKLPFGLTFHGERLYASGFYDLALHGDPRSFGAGSIVRFADPVSGQPDHWLIELEYADVVSPEIVAQYFARLDLVLPAELSGALEWVVRSPQHEAVARRMNNKHLPYYDRVVRYRDLVPAGTVAVYSDGVTAGRLLYVGEGGAQLTEAQAGDIIVTEHVPDWLPPASALITSDPQTPLAHVNLLARNRAIPNASRAGVHDDAGLRQAARVRAHAIVIAKGSSMQIALITRDQFTTWAKRQQPSPVSVPAVDITNMAMVVNLGDLVAQLSKDGVTEAEVADWRTVIGGKSAGFLTLLSTPGLTPPPDPLAITVRPYLEHLAPIRNLVAAAISDSEVVASPRTRWLTLEGEGDYTSRFPSDVDAKFAAAFLAAHSPGSPLGDVLAAGGVRALIEARPIVPDTLTAIRAELTQTYSDYHRAAGLRFRSSSSVEDIEGFNGAGLYTSYTGYLQPELLDDPKDRDNTIERAILRAWSSYWSFEAFEERRLARVDHLSGAMGLTVHARFDDELEHNNGVATFTFLPGGGTDDAVVEINVQGGSVDVTNPNPDDVQLPEVLKATRRGGSISIERRSGSTLLPNAGQVLDDKAVAELFDQTARVAAVWRTRLNDSLPAAQRVQTVVLDFEFKTMDAGWPRLVDGAAPYPARLVLRQVRSLDPGLRALPTAVRVLPVPRDVLMRASLVETVRCNVKGAVPVEHLEIRTDPLVPPDMGYSEHPLSVGPVVSADTTCTRQTRHASLGQALIDLVGKGDAFVIIG